MKMTRRTFAQGMLASASLVAFPSWVRAADAPATRNVVYGGSPWLGHYPAYLADSLGYYKEAGIEQTWQGFATSSARMSAFMSGDVDIGCAGIVSALALMSRGAKQFAIIGIPESFGRVEGIAVRPGIKSVEDLKGKKIGVTFAASTHVLVLDVLKQAGFKPNDATVLNIPGPELQAAIKTGQIDAAAAWTPHFENILREPGVTLLADDTKFSLYQSHKVTPGPDVLLVRRAFAQKNPDLVKAYLACYYKGSDVLREKPEQAAAALTKLTNLPLPEQLAAVKGADWYAAAQQKELLTGVYPDGLQKLAELLVAYKQIDSAPSVKDWIDPSFA
ncbi:ABC transporter substrate-binding protein [Bordetella sp. LUAb4]|uniref:ABC transporter substrate-binding protein n=1 Tax=Bordetella sp. LUAb4 TaxID=2843195 RepID=UPI001E4CB925|nr:ABC transporter substrate-binding protein [Bordetella sp. LUAb4]